MKHLFKFSSIAFAALLLVVGLGSSGCDLINEATNITVPIDIELFPESTNPVIPTVDVDCTDLANLKDYQDNKDAIESGVLKSATFQILDLTEPSFVATASEFTTVSFTLDFDPSYGDTKTYKLGTFTDVNVGALMASQMNIPITDDALLVVNKILDGQEKFCVTASYGPLSTGAGEAAYLRGKLVLSVDFSAAVL